MRAPTVFTHDERPRAARSSRATARAAIVAAIGLFAIFATQIVGCRSDDAARGGSDLRPRYAVFLVHGIYGLSEHFGETADALRARLRIPGMRTVVQSVKYNTLATTQNVDDFAAVLQSTIADTLGPLRDGDQISFVGHSQGGLVIAEWLFARGDSPELAARAAYRGRVDAVVTLGTPYWGSKMANFVRLFAPSVTLADAVREPGAAQLRAMAFGSDDITARRRMWLEREGGPRWLAVGGATGWLDAAAPFSTGRDRFEDDTAVTVPCSNPNFVAYIEDRAGQASVGADAFSVAPEVPFRVVDVIHLSPSTELPQLSPGIAQTPSRCVDATAGCHPAFDLVLAHLSQMSVPRHELDAEMTGFMISVDVQSADHKPISPQLTLHPSSEEIDVAPLTEPYADNEAVSVPYAAAFTSFGSFAQAASKTPRGATVIAEINARGYVSRSVEIPVQAKRSSYVRLVLAPENRSMKDAP